MKQLILVIFSFFLFNCNQTQQTNVNQKEKHIIPEIVFKKGVLVPFAPDVFSQFTNVRDFTITSQDNEAYFTLLSPLGELSVIMTIQKKNKAVANKWWARRRL